MIWDDMYGSLVFTLMRIGRLETNVKEVYTAIYYSFSCCTY